MKTMNHDETKPRPRTSLRANKLLVFAGFLAVLSTPLWLPAQEVPPGYTLERIDREDMESTSAWGVNDLGQVVGSTRVESRGRFNHTSGPAYIWQDGEFTDLPNPGGH